MAGWPVSRAESCGRAAVLRNGPSWLSKSRASCLPAAGSAVPDRESAAKMRAWRRQLLTLSQEIISR